MSSGTTGEAGRRAPLDRARVVETAVALADAKGIGGVTMRAVAGGLGVEAMSLYNHVRNRDDLLDGMVDTVFAEIELPPADSAWREAMRRRADSARRVLRRHPWAVALLDSRSPGAATLRHHEAVLGVLRTGGFSVEAAVRAFFVVDSYVYGAVLQEVGLPFGGQEGLEQVVDDVADRLDVASHPRLVEVATGYASQQGYDFVEAFDAGLTLILGALHPDEG